MLSSRVSSSTKPMKRSKNVDSIVSGTRNSTVVTIPVNFDANMLVDKTVGSTTLNESTAIYDFDVVGMLNTSDVFRKMCELFKSVKIRRVHGCIDVSKVPKVTVTGTYDVVTPGEEGKPPVVTPTQASAELTISNMLVNCAMLRTIQLDRYFREYEYNGGRAIKTYNDVVSIASNIFQTKIPGAACHLSPDIVASGMMEKSQYLATNTFTNLKLLKSYNATQYFLPTFYLAIKYLMASNDQLTSAARDILQQPTFKITNTSVETGVTLSCQFYIDVAVRDIINVYSGPNKLTYSILVLNYTNRNQNTEFGVFPIMGVGSREIYDYTNSTYANNGNALYYLALVASGDTPVIPSDYLCVCTVFFKIIPLGFQVTYKELQISSGPAKPGEYAAYLCVRSDSYAAGDFKVYLSGNDIFDVGDVEIPEAPDKGTTSGKYVFANLAFNVDARPQTN